MAAWKWTTAVFMKQSRQRELTEVGKSGAPGPAADSFLQNRLCHPHAIHGSQDDAAGVARSFTCWMKSGRIHGLTTRHSPQCPKTRMARHLLELNMF